MMMDVLSRPLAARIVRCFRAFYSACILKIRPIFRLLHYFKRLYLRMFGTYSYMSYRIIYLDESKASLTSTFVLLQTGHYIKETFSYNHLKIYFKDYCDNANFLAQMK